MEPIATRVEELIKRLRGHPELLEQMEALAAEVVDEAGALRTADEAEDALVARMRAVGRVALTGWAQRRCAQVNTAAPAGGRKAGKKNCIGKARSGR